MHRNSNKPYRQDWHERKIKTKFGGDFGEFFQLALKEMLDYTTPMRRKRLHHMPHKLKNPWQDLGKGWPDSFGNPFSGMGTAQVILKIDKPNV